MITKHTKFKQAGSLFRSEIEFFSIKFVNKLMIAIFILIMSAVICHANANFREKKMYTIHGAIINAENPKEIVTGIHVSLEVLEPFKERISAHVFQDEEVTGSKLTWYKKDRLHGSLYKNSKIKIITTHENLRNQDEIFLTLGIIRQYEHTIFLTGRDRDVAKEMYDEALSIINSADSKTEDILHAYQLIRRSFLLKKSVDHLRAEASIVRRLIEDNKISGGRFVDSGLNMEASIFFLELDERTKMEIYYELGHAYSINSSRLYEKAKPSRRYIDIATHFFSQAVNIDRNSAEGNVSKFFATKIYQRAYLLQLDSGKQKEAIDTIRDYLKKYGGVASNREVRDFTKHWLIAVQALTGYTDEITEEDFVKGVKRKSLYFEEWKAFGNYILDNFDRYYLAEEEDLRRAFDLSRKILEKQL